MIREAGARISILRDHRLIALWLEYSQKRYCRAWMDVSRTEIFRFVTWTNNLAGIHDEISVAHRAWTRQSNRIQVREHPVQAWGKKPLIGSRFG